MDRHNLPHAPRPGVLCAPLIRHTIGNSIRKYQVRMHRASGDCSRGNGQRKGIGEFGHGLSITNPPVEFCPINLCSFPVPFFPSSSPYLSPSLFLTPPCFSIRSFFFLFTTHTHSLSTHLSIYLSIGWDVRVHESSVNACQVRRRRN